MDRIRQTPHVANNLNRIFYHLLEVDMQFGVGLPSGYGSVPNISLQISNDGGQTWSNPLLASMGLIGKYKTRARFQRLGSSRDRVFRLIVSEPVRCTILGAMLDLESGDS